MKMTPIIPPDVIRILGSDPAPQAQRPEYQAQPEPQSEPKKSFWQKACGFFKKAVQVIMPVIAVVKTVSGILNAVSRFKNATRPRAAW